MASQHLLHFDLSAGCTSHALCSALQSLGATAKAPQSLKTLGPIESSLFQKATGFLESAGYTIQPHDLSAIAHFCVLLRELDPGAVSASRIPIAIAPSDPAAGVLLNLSQGLPVYEASYPAPTCDAPALALLKTCVSYFGPRGESVLLKLGVGHKPAVRALWCQRELVSNTKSSRLVQLSAVIANHHLLPELTHRLSQLGAKRIWTTAVMESGTAAKSLVTAITSEADQPRAVEMFMIMGEASEVNTHVVEQERLSKRVISVVLGKSQKQQVCRVTEYLLGEKILRADPVQEDLETLAKASSQPQDVIRADILSAWKKRSS